ncbi:UDP-glucose 4-epimerase [Agromyces sp. 3263]|uniref:NAD-dependent epimerase/dehydratase family protein n=1 Tax=Agromyces sp. 3263 TaxID=2817750 RepID=UPI002859C6EC|nr:NAD-dependent epimerase/dehydratase family protein [Agromyces sp. 3263]MDR6904803.1 UDP-glucose 4-epimerase [Agromyces sp. 3263]
MRVLITGGAGFIGANLSRRLLDAGDIEVLAFDNLATGLRSNLDPSVRFIEGDLRDPDSLIRATSGVDAIVHLGALPSVPRSLNDPRTTNDVNVIGTLNLLEAARHNDVPHLIAASSSSVYGSNPAIPKVESLATVPVSPYAVSKLATEAYTNAYQTSFGLSAIAFRFFNVFGPLQRADHAYAAVIPRFLAATLSGKPLTVYGDGTQSRDFTSIHAVTDVLEKTLRRRVTSPTPVNLAFGARTSLNEVIDIIRSIHTGPIQVEYTDWRTGDVPHSQASAERLLELVPDARRPQLAAAIEEAYEWYAASAEVR